MSEPLYQIQCFVNRSWVVVGNRFGLEKAKKTASVWAIEDGRDHRVIGPSGDVHAVDVAAVQESLQPHIGALVLFVRDTACVCEPATEHRPAITCRRCGLLALVGSAP